MRRSPFWLIVVFLGLTGVFVFVLPLFPKVRDLPINWTYLCVVGMVGYVAIFAYAMFAVNQDLVKYEKLNDRDKLASLLEDQSALECHANWCAYIARENAKKIQALMPNKEGIEK